MTSFPANKFQDFTVVSIPTRTSFRGITFREAAIFRGTQGWSEFSPFLEYQKIESATWLRAALEGANTPWPHMYRKQVAVNATLPIVPVDQVAGILANFDGCTTVKIKVNDFESGSELVEETLNILPDAKIRLDVNGSWSLEEALLHLHDFHLRFGKVFEYIEQPCTSFEDLAKLKAEVPMKIAVDESIRKNLGSDFSNLRDIADVAIVKWAPTGGISAAHEIAKQTGLPIVVSSALDTGIGISHSLALAASFQSLEYACGLGTIALLESDICDPALIPQGGMIEVERKEPNFKLVEKYRATQERQDWWKNRVIEITENWMDGKEWNL
jgi:O-succinylbenzoate synthase